MGAWAVASYRLLQTQCGDQTMAMPFETLEVEVLRLSPSDRARLLDRVIASLDADKANDQAWDQLAAQRQAQVVSSHSIPLPGAEVLSRLRADLA